MNIVGGAYGETLVIPSRSARLMGSGLRAALALDSRDVSLSTAVSDAEREEFAAATAGLALNHVVSRDRPVRFDYFTPLSTPIISGSGALVGEQITVDDDQVLVYGMIEDGTRAIRVRQAVVDPQSPSANWNDLLAGIRSDETVISVNARELHQIIPGEGEIGQRALALLRRADARAVLVRAGARGCLVACAEQVVWLSAAPTLHVMSIGSGDIFNAAFSYGWFKGADILSAARTAMGATAWFCSTERTQLPDRFRRGESYSDIQAEAAVIANGYQPNVYLAAPFFAVAQRWIVDSVFSWASGLGARVFSPIHHVGPGGDEVARKDIDALERSDVVLALLDGYDAGTVYELGWASRMGIPTVAHLSTLDWHESKMLVGMGAELHDDLTSALYRAIWVGQGAAPAPGRHRFQGTEH